MKKENKLINNLKSENKNSIKSTLREIGDLDLKKAVKPIIELINSNDDEEIIDAAIWTLSRIANPKDLLPLLKSPNSFIKLNVIEALGRLKADELAINIRQFLHDKNPEIRSITAWSIGKMKDYGSYNKLINLIKNDPDSEVRNNAVWALGKLNKKESIDFLKDRLQSESDEIILYNIRDTIQSIESAHQLQPKLAFNDYVCFQQSIKCEKINKERLEFSDQNISIIIQLAKNCYKAKICSMRVKIKND
ncbi:MAG: hypothetical protein GF329_11250 [Candidatus Lokiarchaeota archaeon]|nr:hypothetical protein [Candidatus Lokiarchaeota archaeon]